MDLRAYDLVKEGFRKVTRSTIDDKNPLDTTNVMEDSSTGDAIAQTGETVGDKNAGHVSVVGGVLMNADPGIVTIVDNATIEATLTSASIDFSKYQHFDITYKLGAGAGGTPTLVITVVEIDSNGNEITDSDYTSAALAASSSGHIKGYFESYSTFKVRCTLGGTGTFAASTIEINMK